MANLSVTEKQAEVLDQLARGRTVQEIAHAEQVTAGAVKVRLAAARARLGARTSTQAVAMWASLRPDIGADRRPRQ